MLKSYTMFADVRKLLESIRVIDLLKGEFVNEERKLDDDEPEKEGHIKKKLYWLKHTDTVADAMELLGTQHILSVPVRDPESEQWLGFIDVLDLVTFVIQEVTLEEDAENLQWASYPLSMLDSKDKQSIAKFTTLGEIFETNKRELELAPFCPVSKATNLYELMEDVLSKGIHRVPVIDDGHPRVLGLVSQSDVCNVLCKSLSSGLGYVGEHKGILGETGGMLMCDVLQKLKPGQASVISISQSANVLQALYLMRYNKVSGIAVVDANNKYIGNFSASDLRGFHLMQDDLSSLLLPIMEFLNTTIYEEEKQKLKPLTHNNTLIAAIRDLSVERVHRVWVVNEKNEVDGVFTLTDLCRLICELNILTPRRNKN